MKISNKKIKQIKRLAQSDSPDAIAKKMKLHVNDVNVVLAKVARKRHTNTGDTDRLGALLFWALAFLFASASHITRSELYSFADLPQQLYIQNFILAMVVLFFYWKWKVGEWQFIISPFNLPVLLFSLWAMVSVFYAQTQYEGLIRLLHLLAATILFFLIINGIDRAEKVRKILFSLIITGTITAIIGIIQELFEPDWFFQVIKPAATFGNKNMAAQVVVIILPLALTFALAAKQKSLYWLFSVISALIIVFIIYTQTRAAWLAVLIEFLVLGGFLAKDYFLSRNITYLTSAKYSAFGISFLFVMLMMNVSADGFGWQFYRASKFIDTNYSLNREIVKDKSATVRLSIWANTLEMIYDRPLQGVGLGNHKVFYPAYHRKSVIEKTFSERSQLSNVHNDYLQILAELGVIGFIFFFWILLVGLRVVWKSMTLVEHGEKRFMIIGITAAITGFLVTAMFSFPLQRAIPPIFFMGLTGMVAVLYSEMNPSFKVIRAKWVLMGLFISAVSICGMIWLINYNRYNGDKYFYSAQLSASANRWNEAIKEAKFSLEAFPYRKKTLSYLGRYLIEAGQPQKAVPVLEEVLQEYPYLINAYLNLGLANARIKNFVEAEKYYNKALEIKPDYTRAYTNLANLYFLNNLSEKGYASLKKAADVNPKNPDIYMVRGFHQAKEKRYNEAALSFANAVKYDQNRAEAHMNLGLTYYQYLGEPEKAVVHLERALQLNQHLKYAQEIKTIIAQLKVKLKK